MAFTQDLIDALTAELAEPSASLADKIPGTGNATDARMRIAAAELVSIYVAITGLVERVPVLATALLSLPRVGIDGKLSTDLLPEAVFSALRFTGAGTLASPYDLNLADPAFLAAIDARVRAIQGGATTPVEEALAFTAVTTGLTVDADGTVHNNNTPAPAGAVATKRFGGNGSYVQWRIAENYFGSQAAFIAFTNDASDYNYYGQNNSFGVDSNQVKNGGSKLGAAGDVSENSYVRLVRANTNDINVLVSQDGVTFRPAGTASGVLTDLANPLIVVKFSAPSADRIMREVRGFNLVTS